MDHLEKLSKHLVALGIPKPEADAYVQLYILAAEGSATGYQVAKAMGKDPTSVYKALEELRRKGFVETVAGRGKQFRPEDPDILLKRLERKARANAFSAKMAFREVPRPQPEQEVFRLTNRIQTIDRFKQLLDETRNVALLDMAPRALDRVLPAVQAAADRGVTVVAKLYREPDERQLARLKDVTWVIEPEGELMIDIMPGPVLHGVFDCRAQLVTYLDSYGERELTQAFWTPNLFLAFQAHSGLASEIIHTALRGGIGRGESAADLDRLNDEFARRVHGTVDWESFWQDAGFGDPGRRRRIREKSRLPWSGQKNLTAELLDRKNAVLGQTKGAKGLDHGD